MMILKMEILGMLFTPLLTMTVAALINSGLAHLAQDLHRDGRHLLSEIYGDRATTPVR